MAQSLELDRLYPLGNGKDSLAIETFRCYISALRFYQDEKLVWAEPDSYHLLDASDPASLVFAAVVPSQARYNRFVFTVGIDSVTNAKGVGGADLDPAKGMYWTWQSGYINMKIEGRSAVCNTRKHAFQYHLGGFLDGNACDQLVRLHVTEGAKEIKVNIDLARFFEELNLGGSPMVMIPGEEAKRLARKAATMFTLVP